MRVRNSSFQIDRAITVILIALCVVSLAIAQNGPANMVSLPIKAIDGKMIQLQDRDGKTYTFALDAKTIYCQGVNVASNWAYLKGRTEATTMKLAADHKTALVVWDQGPSLSMSLNTPTSGSGGGSFPDMCSSLSYWIDPATKLMWTNRDNGIYVNWNQAEAYCKSLRVGGYSNWRLPTINELTGIYAPSAQHRIKGGIVRYVDDEWTSSPGSAPEKVVTFNFWIGSRNDDATRATEGADVLCVRQQTAR